MASVAAPGQGSPPKATSQLARKYPPLLALAIVVFIALFILPSALNLPQTNPTQTLEYAPVPPNNDKNPPPSNGNLSSLGLAGSDTLQGGPDQGTGNGGGADIPGVGPGGQGKSPRTKNCVGNPPRQTEDPLSPPCVADFRGDNFGATYQGVTRDEAVVLFYVQGFTNYVNTCQDPGQVTPDRQYFDLAQPAQPNEHCVIRILRTYMQYFNDRFQTYGRYVHGWVYFSGAGESAEERRADAADNYAKLHPFAVISTGNSYGDEYLDSMARRGVLNFGSFAARPLSFFQQYPKLVWSYTPALEKEADSFAAYICKKVKPNPVDSASDPTLNNKPRVYGYWHSGDAQHPELTTLADVVKSDLQSQCGLTFKDDATFPESGYEKSNHYTPASAQRAAAKFQADGVTTVIWPGGLETNFTQQASAIKYGPEFLLLGDDGVNDTNTAGTFQDQNDWNHAHVITIATDVRDPVQAPCYQAYKEADPNGADVEIRGTGCAIYPNIRQLFVGIQVAGPRLGPTSIDKGFHAIPPVASSDPQTPACYYDAGDYTCVKDAQSEWWDPTGRESNTSSAQGCWREIQSGKRYFPTIWPDGNMRAQENGTEPCNRFDSSYLVNPAPPSGSTIGQ
jgi:hypothetical protein